MSITSELNQLIGICKGVRRLFCEPVRKMSKIHISSSKDSIPNANSFYPVKCIDSDEIAEINLFLQHKNNGMLTINGRVEIFAFSDEINSTKGTEDVSMKEEASSEVMRSVSDSACGLASLETGTASHSTSSGNPTVLTRKRSSSFSAYTTRRPSRRRSSSLGDLDDLSSQKTLTNLVASMTEIFPDYSFDTVKPKQFIFQDLSTVMTQVNSHLVEICEDNLFFLNKFWTTIDFFVDIHRCDIFEYKSKFTDDDPFTDGCLWSMNYFLLNKDTMRLAYFTCAAVR